ncbi:MAG: uroporphyrinogen-III synthase [Alphaproteobacteria bacterium]|nr:uroporphyrinogen-III synthase [Alphaproteobacteria bacterium]
MAHNPAPYILLTRPLAQSTAYKATLEAEFGARVAVIVSPLLKIKPVAADIDLAGVRHLLFTSVNGVEAYTRLTNRRDIAALCVGARTTAAAQAAGIEARSADGSADDLVALAQSQTGPFLYARGVHMARDIAAQLRAGGQRVKEVVTYDQQPLSLTPKAKAALTGDVPCLVPLFSPRSARLFIDECQGVTVQSATAICISRNVADQLDPERFKHPVLAAHPTAAAITREIAASL